MVFMGDLFSGARSDNFENAKLRRRVIATTKLGRQHKAPQMRRQAHRAATCKFLFMHYCLRQNLWQVCIFAMGGKCPHYIAVENPRHGDTKCMALPVVLVNRSARKSLLGLF
jgi:hypothetical protein